MYLLSSLLVAALSASAAEPPFEWTAPPPAVQLHGDEGVIPLGKGAVFIPSLVSSESEPPVLIVDDLGASRAPTGRRVILDPGAYVVLVGTGAPDQRVGVPIVIEEGRTTVVPARWGGLRLEVVNRKLKPRDDGFDLIHVATGERVSLPAELADGDAPTTWLLKPGLYRIQEPGSDTMTAPVFSTVFVPEGGLVHQRVFVDKTGAIRGGGVIPAAEYQNLEVRKKPWATSLIVGIDASGTQTQNMPGFPDLTTAEGSAFVDLDVSYADDRNVVKFKVQGDYGLLYLQPATGEPLPLIKSRDRLHGLASYTFRFNDGAGVYVRGGATTQMTPTYAISTEPGTIAFREADGSIRNESVRATSTTRIADAFSPMMVSTGGGLEVRLATSRSVDFALRGGVGHRLLLFSDTYVASDNPNTPAIEYTAIANYQRPGVEVGAAGTIRLTGFATYTTSLDLFTDIDRTGGLMKTWDNQVSVRLTRAVSLNYALNAAHIPWITNRVSLRQGAFVRFGLNIL